MDTPGTAYCTCTGCPPDVRKILFHVWQLETWAREQVFEPCADDPAECCGCGDAITQEDLLCDECRQRGGISSTDTRRPQHPRPPPHHDVPRSTAPGLSAGPFRPAADPPGPVARAGRLREGQ